MKKYLLMILLLPVLITACKKEKIKPVPNVDCTEFASALLSNDIKKVELQVNNFFEARKAMPDQNDEFGYEKHYNTWAEQIEACPNLKVTYVCYYCYQSYPLTGEIHIELTNGTTTIKRYIYTSFDRINGKYRFKQMGSF